MKNILVPIGSSENALNTLQYAIDFASIVNAKIFVFRAYSILTKSDTFINKDSIMQHETDLYIRTIVNAVDKKDIEIKKITAKGSILDNITDINKELGIDLIIMGPKSNSTKEEVFLGKTSGSIVKQTEIPILIIPEGYVFKPMKRVLTAFKSGVINRKDVLNPLSEILYHFNAKTNLLLVKIPYHTPTDLVLSPELEDVKSKLIITENATTFQGVLMHFQSNNPDMLCVFRRKRGFFKKLWEKNTILKKEFYCNIPLLVLSGK